MAVLFFIFAENIKMNLPPEQIRKFEILLEKCNAAEIRARNYAKQLEAKLRKELSESIFEDFDIEAEFFVYSEYEACCAKKILSLAIA